MKRQIWKARAGAFKICVHLWLNSSRIDQNPIARSTSLFGRRNGGSGRESDRIGILQAVTGDRADDSARLRASDSSENAATAPPSQLLNNPAMEAALAGSTKIPS